MVSVYCNNSCFPSNLLTISIFPPNYFKSIKAAWRCCTLSFLKNSIEIKLADLLCFQGIMPMFLFARQEHSWWCSPLTDPQLSPNPAFCPLHNVTDCFLNCCSILFSLRVWGFVNQKFRKMFCEVTYIVANLNLCSLGNGVYLCFSPLPQVKQKIRKSRILLCRGE